MMPFGRAASAVRPGQFVKRHLSQVEEDYIENIHRAYKEEYQKDWLTNHPSFKIFHGHVCTYASFNRYFNQLKSWGLVEFVREAPIVMQKQAGLPSLLQIDTATMTVRLGTAHYFRLTALGNTAHPAWDDPAGERIRRGGYI